MSKPILQEIESNFAKFTSDADYVRGIEKLDREHVHREFENIKESYATFINFYVFRRYMKALKARRGGLAAQTEKDLAMRGETAIEAYRRATASLEAVAEALYSSGVAKAIERHSKAIHKHLDLNPKTPVIIDEFRRMGVPEDAIAWVYNKVREAGYDLLRTNGLNGTISDLVKRAKDLVPKLSDNVRVLKQHGLSTIQGAGDDEDEYVEAGVVTGIAIICGIFCGFCFDWRPFGLPAVKHWQE